MPMWGTYEWASCSAHEPSGFDGFLERVLRAEVLREDDHDLVADVLVDHALATAQSLSGDPGEEVVDEGEGLHWGQIERPRREAGDVGEKDRRLQLAALHRVVGVPAVVQLGIGIEGRSDQEVLKRSERVADLHSFQRFFCGCPAHALRLDPPLAEPAWLCGWSRFAGARNGARTPTDSSRSQPISIWRQPLETVPHVAQRASGSGS
jgi:hypothetical protein